MKPLPLLLLLLAAPIFASVPALPMPDDICRQAAIVRAREEAHWSKVKKEEAEVDARRAADYKLFQVRTRKLAKESFTAGEKAVYDKVQAILKAREEVEGWER